MSLDNAQDANMKGCDVCNAKQRMRVSYGRKMLCGECYYEYRMIFEGILSKKTQKRIQHEKEHPNDNPLFDAFKRGWESEERESLLGPLPIPKWIEDDYKELYRAESERWKQSEVDNTFNAGDFWKEAERRKNRYMEMLEEQRRIDGISENP